MSLIAQNITLQLHKNTVLHNTTLEVNPGEVVALLGPNGAGKSTLLHVLSGELIPQAGQVYVNNRLRTDWSLIELAQTMAVLPQLEALNFPLSAQEVVMLGRIPHITLLTENQLIVEKCLRAMDMLLAKERQYSWLSGGERQRVQIARVLAQIIYPTVNRDRYLLLDEPTSALDLAHQQHLLRLLREMAQQNIGVVLTVHDLNLAMQYADRVVLLQAGKIVAEGEPSAVLTADNIARVFNVAVTKLVHPQVPDKFVLVYGAEPAYPQSIFL